MNYKILIADDEIELLDVLELYFQKEEMLILKARDGKEALEIFYKEEPHLVILDIMMPEVSGFDVLRKIRKVSKIPAIMLTAKIQDCDKILGLEFGADDYITKPYNPLEVVARVKAQLRRSYDYIGDQIKKNRDVQLFNLTLKPDEGILIKENKVITLTGTELRILELLMNNSGRIFTKQQLFDIVWDDTYFGDDNTIMVHISNIRAKIEDNPRIPTMLKTVKGIGYKFEKER